MADRRYRDCKGQCVRDAQVSHYYAEYNYGAVFRSDREKRRPFFIRIYTGREA